MPEGACHDAESRAGFALAVAGVDHQNTALFLCCLNLAIDDGFFFACVLRE
jgi:hypothetical protein